MRRASRASRRWCVWVGAWTLLALVGCGESQEARDLRKETREAWSAAKAWGVAQRGEAERVFSSSVEGLSKTYEAAKAKAETAGQDATKGLEPKWQEVRQKLDEMKAAGADKWVEARDAFVRAYEAFKKEVSPGS